MKLFFAMVTEFADRPEAAGLASTWAPASAPPELRTIPILSGSTLQYAVLQHNVDGIRMRGKRGIQRTVVLPLLSITAALAIALVVMKCFNALCSGQNTVASMRSLAESRGCIEDRKLFALAAPNGELVVLSVQEILGATKTAQGEVLKFFPRDLTDEELQKLMDLGRLALMGAPGGSFFAFLKFHENELAEGEHMQLSGSDEETAMALERILGGESTEAGAEEGVIAAQPATDSDASADAESDVITLIAPTGERISYTRRELYRMTGIPDGHVLKVVPRELTAEEFDILRAQSRLPYIEVPGGMMHFLRFDERELQDKTELFDLTGNFEEISEALDILIQAGRYTPSIEEDVLAEVPAAALPRRPTPRRIAPAQALFRQSEHITHPQELPKEAPGQPENEKQDKGH